MSDDYLWDRSGEIDPEIQTLEGLLEPFRYAATEPTALIAERPIRRGGFRHLIAAAAMFTCAAWLFHVHAPGPRPYCVRDTRGDPAVLLGSRRATLSSGRFLAPGDWIETGPTDEVSLSIADIGSIRLMPGGRLGIADADDLDPTGRYGLVLDRGTLSATIYSAPRIFQVGTPAGIAVDMGCVYRATVTDAGDTILSVVMGVVQFETQDGFAYVPADAECIATPLDGPCPPYWSDKDDAFQRAARARDLNYLATHAEPRDTLTLWHFLLDDDPDVRARALGALFDREAGPECNTDLLLAGDREAIDDYRRSFVWSW